MTSHSEPQYLQEREPTGVTGLDDVLAGGLPAGHLYLVEGNPGAGKTTLGLQFLLRGRDLGQPCLYVTLSETSSELGTNRSIPRLDPRRPGGLRSGER